MRIGTNWDFKKKQTKKQSKFDDQLTKQYSLLRMKTGTNWFLVEQEKRNQN